MTTRRTKSPGRKRRTLGWTLAVVGLIIAGVWFASRWWQVIFFLNKGHVALGSGALVFTKQSPFSPQAFELIRPIPKQNRRWSWWMEEFYQTQYTSITTFGLYKRIDLTLLTSKTSVHTLLLWPLPILCWVPAYFFLRSGYRVRRLALGGCCVKCGYDLAGLGTGSPCPECGKLPGAAGKAASDTLTP